ncbi:hypothetical protein EV424DRAFT_1546852 [Suillus variegatus]|nr:hypothetical protein EV424DRAFT_1546852 [Suillus variegatus]
MTRGSSSAQGPLLPEHREHIGKHHDATPMYLPYVPFRPRAVNAILTTHPSVPIDTPHAVNAVPTTHPSVHIDTEPQSMHPASRSRTPRSHSPSLTSVAAVSQAPVSRPDTPYGGLSADQPAVIQEVPICQVVPVLYAGAGCQRLLSMPPSSGGEHDVLMDYDLPLRTETDHDMLSIQPRATSLALTMDTSPIVNSKSTDPPLQTPSPERPFIMPSTIETHLDRLVTQRFLELSHNVLTPALKDAIDAMIPSMVERLSDDMRNISVRHQPHTHKEDSLSDTQASDSDDGLAPHPQRKRPGKRGSKNHLHVAFRSYLQEKRVLKGKNGSLPQSPPIKTIQAFNHNHDCCPTLDDLSIDWSDSLKKSSWNTEVINILVVDFQLKIKNGTYVQVLFHTEAMSLDNLRSLCIDKLRRTQFECRQRTQIGKYSNLEEMNSASRALSGRNEQRQHLDRCNTRKHGTLERHRKIVAQNRHRNPDTWDTIGRIIDRLDVDGVSRDETDTPIGAIPKVVRRVGLPWLNPDITQLLHAVETYAPATHEENMTIPIGNSSLPRILEQKRAAQNSIAIQRLPRNWYNDHWYKANSSSARALLETRKSLIIPALEHYRSQKQP